MPNRVPNTQWLLLVAFVALAGLIMLLTSISPSQQKGEEAFPERSIYNNEASGYRAWYLTNQKAGLPLLIWQKSFLDFDKLPKPASMVMVDPYTVVNRQIIFSKKELAMLSHWVAEGNTLVLLDQFSRPDIRLMASKLGLQPDMTLPQPEKLQKSAPTPKPEVIFQLSKPKNQLKDYVHRPLVTNSQYYFSTNFISSQPEPTVKSPPEVILSNHEGQPVLVRVPYQKGAFILGTIPDLGANHFLHNPSNDNYQFLTNLLIQEKKPIFINEFVHGYNELADVYAYFQKETPIGQLFTQFLLAFIFLLWLSFVRWTPKADSAALASSRQDSGLRVYIQSLAGIYYKTQAASLVLEPLLKQVEAHLRQRFRMNLDEENRLRHLLGSLLAHYSSKNESPDAMLEAIQSAQRAIAQKQALPHRDLLKLTRQLTYLEEKLQQRKAAS